MNLKIKSKDILPMNQLEANTMNTEKMNNIDINFDDNMLPPAPASVTREATVVLDNIPDNNILYDEYLNMPPPKLERTTTSYGKHYTPGYDVEIDEDTEFLLPPLSVLERQTTTWIGKETVEKKPQFSNSFVSTICDNDLPTDIPELTHTDTLESLRTEEIIHEAYMQELLVSPFLEFKKEHYSGLPYDPINFTHLNEDVREYLSSKLPNPPKLERQTNGPPYSGPSLLGDDDLDDMPPSPLLVRTDSEHHYINPFGRNDSS